MVEVVTAVVAVEATNLVTRSDLPPLTDQQAMAAMGTKAHFTHVGQMQQKVS